MGESREAGSEYGGLKESSGCGCSLLHDSVRFKKPIDLSLIVISKGTNKDA